MNDDGRHREQSLRAWQAALDDMTERLAEGWTTLANGGVEVRPFSAPTGLGPLPLELRELAAGILEETRAFETALRDRSDAVARELAMIKRTPEEPRAAARFFDRAI